MINENFVNSDESSEGVVEYANAQVKTVDDINSGDIRAEFARINVQIQHVKFLNIHQLSRKKGHRDPAAKKK